MNTNIVSNTNNHQPRNFSSGVALAYLKKQDNAKWPDLLRELHPEEMIAINNDLIMQIMSRTPMVLDHTEGRLEGVLVRELQGKINGKIIALESMRIPYSDNSGGWRIIGYLGIG